MKKTSIIAAVLIFSCAACNKYSCECDVMKQVPGLDSLVLKESFSEKSEENCETLEQRLSNEATTAAQSGDTIIPICRTYKVTASRK